MYGLDLLRPGYCILISAKSTVGGNKRGDDDSYGVYIEFLSTLNHADQDNSHLAKGVINTEYAY